MSIRCFGFGSERANTRLAASALLDICHRPPIPRTAPADQAAPTTSMSQSRVLALAGLPDASKQKGTRTAVSASTENSLIRTRECTRELRYRWSSWFYAAVLIATLRTASGVGCRGIVSSGSAVLPDSSGLRLPWQRAFSPYTNDEGRPGSKLR